MKSALRLLAASVATASLLAVSTGAVLAQAKYPSRTVEVVVPFAPGGGTDNLAGFEYFV